MSAVRIKLRRLQARVFLQRGSYGLLQRQWRVGRNGTRRRTQKGNYEQACAPGTR